MISRITRVIFLFALVGFSTISFQNTTLQTSVNELTDESKINGDYSIDMELFTALVYLLLILGFSVMLLILIVNQTHLSLMDSLHKSDKSFTNYSI